MWLPLWLLLWLLWLLLLLWNSQASALLMPSCYEMLPPGYNNDLLVLRLATLLGKIEGTTNGKKGFQSRKTQIKVWHHSCEKFREKFWGGNWWKASDADVESNQVRMRERMQGCRSLIVGCGQHPCGHWHQPLHMVDNSHCAWSPVHAQVANIHRFCISIWYILYLGIPQSVCRTSWHQIASPGGIFRSATAPLILYRKTMCNCA